nr:polyadenylate-binding protein-interacting protein 3-like isoform X1 [Ipomoea batatas]
MSGLSSDMPEGQGKARRKAQSANSCTHSSVVSTSDRGGTALVSAGSGLSNSSSVSSLSSEKSNLNPHAKEFKLNPNAKSFVPSQSPLRPASPVSDGSFYYPTNVTPVQHMHGMPVGVGIGPSYAGHQPVMFNHQVAPTPQPYFHPNGPQYGQQMIIGHPRQVVYMPTYPPEMPFRRGDF